MCVCVGGLHHLSLNKCKQTKGEESQYFFPLMHNTFIIITVLVYSLVHEGIFLCTDSNKGHGTAFQTMAIKVDDDF